MGNCFSDLEGGKQAVGAAQLRHTASGTSNNNNGGHNDAVEFFYRSRGLHPLFSSQCHCLVQLEGDAKSVIEAVNSREPDEGTTGQLTADIHFMVGAIPEWEMIYTRREANQVAHCLAKAAIIHKMDKVWLCDPPECIRDLLQADLSALPDVLIHQASMAVADYSAVNGRAVAAVSILEEPIGDSSECSL